ncbi:MAG: FAD-dependent pyridine nucleotide-disulfide oxidoreductase [Herbinix sp.]|jgi:NADPH-dependent 2,4-dienoyl-CoA reductase/sulfur reductase-like enzyme|nr:FAD-dependent pyridine nucleotide-disulfide oxidoreductase [Herbinix sp.]
MRIIIIGGVAAGMSAASKIARMDKTCEVVVYEKGGFLSYGACGLPYYVGDYNDDYRRMIARTQEKFSEAGIETHLYHEVVKVDVEKKQIFINNLKDKTMFIDKYDKLMIATGAASLVPPFPGVDLLGVHVLKTLEDGIFLKEYAANPEIKNVTIVGGGYIGIECVEAFLSLGKEVRLIEAAGRILTPFDEELSELAQKEIEKHGVNVHLNEKVKAFHGASKVNQIETDKGMYNTDLVIVAIGIRPSTEFLKDTGIRMAKNGAILVDRELRTSIEDIYAAGDCILVYNEAMEEDSYLALGTVANKCGRIAGANLAGEHQKFIGALGSAAIKVCNLEMGRTGLGEADAKRLKKKYKTVIVQANDHPAYYPNPTPITIKVIYEAGSLKLLGAQACGEKGAVMRIDSFAVAIHAGMTTDELGMTDLVYAPPFSGVWDAIQIACNLAK